MFKKTILCAALAFLATQTSVGVAASDVSKKIDDTAITAKVKMVYAKSPLIKTTDISVTTVNHTVFLAGQVATDQEYEKAISLAKSVKEVDDVDAAKLQVSSSQTPIHDTYITAKVKGTLLKERLFGDREVEYWPIKVETKNSVVYLTGKVDTQAQKKNVLRVVRKVKGVKSVHSSLSVK